MVCEVPGATGVLVVAGSVVVVCGTAGGRGATAGTTGLLTLLSSFFSLSTLAANTFIVCNKKRRVVGQLAP